jgi:pimeloyl-ACP methyl ester carboxylesterase
MAYQPFVPLTNLNFQFNRVFTYGDVACREEELWEIAPRLQKFDYRAWHREWHGLAVRAEGEQRLMHAAYYHRLSEFFLPDGFPEKEEAYHDFHRCFYEAVAGESLEKFEVPYPGGHLPVLRLKAPREKGVILVHGGFDSFMEEFYIELKRMPEEQGYTVILFEGPGQGRTLREGLKMTHEWERPVSSVLDYFRLDRAALVGISLGGYLALRAAAYEPRIARVAAYGVVYDAFECFARNFPDQVIAQFREMVDAGKKEEVTAWIETLRQSSDILEWTLTHGMYISGTTNLFDYLHFWMNFNTREISRLIEQDVLLLAGENDHFVPLEMYRRQKEALVKARSVRGRVFTAAEGGDQHCQVGRLDLAWNEILDWLNGF